MNTVHDEWMDFEKLVIPAEAGRGQRAAMRRAFYGGAVSSLFIMQRAASEGVSINGGAAILDGLLEECADFAEAVKRGEA